MGVIATKILSGYQLIFEFDCSNFDNMVANGTTDGWEEVSRDCDHKPPSREWDGYPFSSKSTNTSEINLATNVGSGARVYKRFDADEDEVLTELDLSDMNGGILPTNVCAMYDVYQNGNRLSCTLWEIDFDTKLLAIGTDRQAPGVNYEVLFWPSVTLPETGGGFEAEP